MIGKKMVLRSRSGMSRCDEWALYDAALDAVLHLEGM